MTFTPYTKDAVTRIRKGATARELGWDDLFYSRVCREHGIPPNVPAPKTHTLAEIAASASLVPAPVAEPAPPDDLLSAPTGRCTFHPATGELYRQGHCLKMPPRMAEVFVYISKGTPLSPANGVRLTTELIPGAGGIIVELRKRLLDLNLKIAASRKRDASGYWLADFKSGVAIKIISVGPKARAR